MNSALEKHEWEPLVEVLREELQEYGGLFNLLDRQQEEIFRREPDTVIETNEEIERYMADMGDLRQKREEMVSDLAENCGRDKDLSLKDLISALPDYARPLLQALADDVNHMVDKTRRKARQNFLLLSRTMELTQETIRALQPDRYTKTYSKKGRVGMSNESPSRYKTFV